MAEARLDEIRKSRFQKADKLRELGIDPYPSKVKGVAEPIVEVINQEGSDKGVVGRLWGLRVHGNTTFADLKDDTGKVQLWFQKNNLGDSYRNLKYLDLGDFLYAQGRVTKTEGGEVRLDVDGFQLLTKSIRPLPSTWFGLKDVEERYRQRYVDLLVNDDVKTVFQKRAQIVRLMRNKLDAEGFLEVKTPSFQPLYGGATANPFITHHNALDIDLYLRISDELYLKRLIVGGFGKVYEIGTDFRNEGIDRWHNPEFSMLEFYWAYADYNDLMDFTQKLLSEIVKEVCGDYKIKYGEMEVDFSLPWKRLTYKDAIQEHVGIDIDKFENADELKKAIKNQVKEIDLSATNDIPSILDETYKSQVRDKLVDPVYLIDHPYFMRPLAKRKTEDPSKVESFQLVAAGAELINAYSELNDPQDQKERWQEDMKRAKEGVDDYQLLDEDYIRALEYGMPPTAGWGLGIDRFTALLTNQHSLKDVILFPTLRPEKQYGNKE